MKRWFICSLLIALSFCMVSCEDDDEANSSGYPITLSTDRDGFTPVGEINDVSIAAMNGQSVHFLTTFTGLSTGDHTWHWELYRPDGSLSLRSTGGTFTHSGDETNPRSMRWGMTFSDNSQTGLWEIRLIIDDIQAGSRKFTVTE